MKKVASYALGCKVNQYESEAIAELFAEKGYDIVEIDETADIYIINTCTVTNLGDKKSRQLIRKVKRQNPESIVAVIGCYAQTAPEEIQKIEGVNLVIGTKGRNQLVELVEQYQKETGVVNFVEEIKKEKEFEPLSIQKLANRTRAYLKIQDGCSQFCTYCIIPYARGPIRSRDPQSVIEEVQTLAKNGFQEIVLTGIHIASYGKDRKDIDLLEILKRVHAVEGIKRIRFSSIEPNVITEKFVDALSALPKVCHHFHLSLQSGCNQTLKAMNRKYSAEKYEEAVNLLKKAIPDVALTTDIIVGFPGETEENFQECYAFASKIAFSKIHVFPYSAKKGTPAAEMKGQLPNEIKNQRAKKLLELSEKDSRKFMEQFLNCEQEVLFEKEVSPGVYEGHTSNYMKVIAKSAKDLKNCLQTVVIQEISEDCAFGTLRQ